MFQGASRCSSKLAKIVKNICLPQKLTDKCFKVFQGVSMCLMCFLEIKVFLSAHIPFQCLEPGGGGKPWLVAGFTL